VYFRTKISVSCKHLKLSKLITSSKKFLYLLRKQAKGEVTGLLTLFQADNSQESILKSHLSLIQPACLTFILLKRNESELSVA
jgi:metal-responsive CopG/Arc/MetJ family transcriptional regulator